MLIDEGENAYISDFGLAKLRTASSLTNTGMIMGTAAYMSPEQWKGKQPLDERADIYSLGIMLFEMITGRLPFEADTIESMLYLHLFEPIPQINDLRSDIPQTVQQVIDRATAKEHDQRTSSCHDIVSGLKNALVPALHISQMIENEIIPETEQDFGIDVDEAYEEAMEKFVPTPHYEALTQIMERATLGNNRALLNKIDFANKAWAAACVAKSRARNDHEKAIADGLLHKWMDESAKLTMQLEEPTPKMIVEARRANKPFELQ